MTCLGHDTSAKQLLSSYHGAILASVVMGEVPDVLVITHTAVRAGSGHPYSSQHLLSVNMQVLD